MGDPIKIIKDINKKYGDFSIIKMGDTDIQECIVIPTGILKIDLALGVGGFPRGRISEVYGPESSGKTTLCQHVIANCQVMGGLAAFIDVEQATDPYWLGVCGVNIDDLYLSQPDTGEQALDILEMLTRSKEFDVIVVDSVAALVPRAEIEGEMGDSHMGLQARLMSQAMRKLSSAVKQSHSVVIFTNQLRMKIGVVFGNPEVTTGGMALRFYASLRIDCRKRLSIKCEGLVVGNQVQFTIKKNKVAPPFQQVMVDLYYNEGLSHLSEIKDYGIELGLIKKGGAWFTIGDQKFHGEGNLRQGLKDNQSLMQLIEDEVRQQNGLPIVRYE